jgi:hypothetical protein
MLSQYHYDDTKYGHPDPFSSSTLYSGEEDRSTGLLADSVNQATFPTETPEASLHDVYEAVGRIHTGPVVSPPRGSMRTYSYTVRDNKRMLTVMDTGTAPNLIPKSVLLECGYQINRA